MKQILLVIGLITLLLFITGCTQSIAEVKDLDNVGKTVKVRGEVKTSVKIGQLSGYIIKDKSGESIGVLSQNLPQEGETVTAKGVLMKDSLFGYYIKIQE